MIKDIKGAIFDLDGTLLDTMRMWRYVGNDYLLSIGVAPSPTLHNDLRHMYLKTACDFIAENYDTGRNSEQIFAEIKTQIANFYNNEARLKDGALPFLEKLKEQGVKMCIATATDKSLMMPAIERLGIHKFFSGIFTCFELSTTKKEPLIYNTAHKFLGTPIENTYVFEDVFVPAQTAKWAGFKVVGVYDSMENLNADKLKQISDLYINSFEELL